MKEPDEFFSKTRDMGVLWLNMSLTYDPNSELMKDTDIIPL